MPATVPVNSRYLPQMDGARAIAVLAVVLHHYGVHGPDGWDWGPIGPVVFFMMSGYLVTKAMLGLRDRVAEPGELVHFHIRRFCRLIPPLYLMIGIGVLFGLSEFVDHWHWHALFATNFLIASQNEWVGSASHLWSLGVQEQFYVLWPFLVLLAPRKWLVPAFFAAAGMAVVWRLGCIASDVSPLVRWLLLPGSLDTFAAGALTAVWAARRPVFSLMQKAIMAFVAAGCFVLSTRMRFIPLDSPWAALVELPEAVFFCWVLIRLLDDSSWPSRLLRWRPLVEVGKLSYGIFVYHILAWFLFAPALDRLGMERGQFVAAAMVFSATVVLSAVSYHLIELPATRWARSLRIDFSWVLPARWVPSVRRAWLKTLAGL
ncbi:MAG: acyltransferase [Terrimicrobiaceae bacterium]|nr:acyltransferase [Terrimicrobiaceae bacterium]